VHVYIIHVYVCMFIYVGMYVNYTCVYTYIHMCVLMCILMHDYVYMYLCRLCPGGLRLGGLCHILMQKYFLCRPTAVSQFHFEVTLF
jgi:hypothetical protein